MSGKVKVILGVLGTAILVSGIWATVMHFRTKAITEKCAAYMLQVLNDFCAELPFSGDDCCIYRNILKEAREWLPYRYVGLRA